VDLRAHIATLESAAGDPREGLPPDVFLLVSRLTPLINVDLLIQDDGGRTLLTWRDDQCFGAGWHLPGGIIRYQEPAEDRLRACAREELGAEISFDPVPLLVSETIRDRNTRGHFISLLFRCRLLGPPDEVRNVRSDRPAAGDWRWHGGCPPDLLDVQRPYARFF
jgi:ADP-ribose pyrophosphatase YjhB (NUDIX family)